MGTHATSLTDTELAFGVANGDSAAETSLYEKYSERMFYLALSERHSREDAEDIRAETFLRVIAALREGKLRKPGSLSSFIVGIALNVMREHRRRGTGESLTELDDHVAGERSPEETLVNAEEAQSILRAAAQLKQRDRDFLRMYYYEELSKEEISQALGIKEERLRLIKSRALKRFQEIYARLASA